MTAIAMRVRKRADEDPVQFTRRRGREARAVCKTMGLWSLRWFQRAVRWHEHIQRHPRSAACALFRYHDHSWLQQRRAALLPANPRTLQRTSVLAGRTQTRMARGFVHQRWEEGVAFAKGHLS